MQEEHFCSPPSWKETRQCFIITHMHSLSHTHTHSHIHTHTHTHINTLTPSERDFCPRAQWWYSSFRCSTSSQTWNEIRSGFSGQLYSLLYLFHNVRSTCHSRHGHVFEYRHHHQKYNVNMDQMMDQMMNQ